MSIFVNRRHMKHKEGQGGVARQGGGGSGRKGLEMGQIEANQVAALRRIVQVGAKPPLRLGERQSLALVVVQDRKSVV